MNETNLPCSECKSELVARTVETADLPVSTRYQGEVRIAECPSCRARYYPEKALTQLSMGATSTDIREESDSL